MLIQKNAKLVFMGDSITDMGRAQPVGEGLFDPFGRGYVAQTEAFLNARYPELNLYIINVGVSGNTSRDMVARWQRDVIDLKPDWLSVMIGTNDVWRQYDLPHMQQTHVYPDEYEQSLKNVIGQTRPTVRGLIMMTPFFIEPNKQDPMRAQMDRYSAITRKVAQRYDCLLVDTQAAFDEVLQHVHPARLAWDRIHPNQMGAAVITRAFLKAIGYEF
jgi:lysophospholipase L1-like esterase